METRVVNVKVAFLRPRWNSLEEWCNTPGNVYIGRKGVVFCNGVRYPPANSIFANPYKIGKDGTREEVLAKYRVWIQGQMQNPTFVQELQALRGCNLGCWCAGEAAACHGDILVEILRELDNPDNKN